MLNANPNWFLLDTMWSKEAADFAKADLEYKTNDIKLRLNALYPFPFLYESGEQKTLIFKTLTSPERLLPDRIEKKSPE